MELLRFCLVVLQVFVYTYTYDIQNKTGDDIFTSGIEINGCSVNHLELNLRRKLATFVEEGKKLIFIHISFADHDTPIPEGYKGNVYKLMDWVRTYGRHGRSLLFLRPQFEHLSLTTLSYETARMIITLTQTPNRCLSDQNVSTIEKNLRRLLVLDSKMSEKEDGIVESEYICNNHVHNVDSRVDFRYVCCHDHERTMEHLHCEEMQNDFWMDLLFLCVFFIKIVVIMYSPFLIPESLYRRKYAENDYEHILLKPIEIKIKKVTEDKKSSNSLHRTVDIANVKRMKKFFTLIKDAPIDKVIKLSLNKIVIKVRHDRLVPSNYVPVGILPIFYTMLMKCHIRKTPSFARCCRGSVFGRGFVGAEKTNVTIDDKDTEQSNDKIFENDALKMEVNNNSRHPWYKCLRQFLRFLLLLTMSIPWIFRMYFFFHYEQSEAIDQRKAADIRNLTLPSFEWNLTYTLTPIHNMFLICYTIIVLDALVFGLVSSKIKKKLQFLMRKCLRDMHEMSRSKAFEWCTIVLLVPCEICGIFGFIVAGLYLVLALPIVVIVLAFYCLPTVSLTLRLLAHFFIYMTPMSGTCCGRELFITFKKKCNVIFTMFHLNMISDSIICFQRPESISFKNRFLQIFVLLACLLTVFSFVLLTMETLIFFIEMILYTVIGIIMNATAMLKYISLIFMLGLYARDCFKGVTDKYLEFNKTINSLIVDMNRVKVEAIASASVDEQRNTAFQIRSDRDDNIEDEQDKDVSNIRLVCKDGIPKWCVRRLILFLDRHDEPYLTEKFFFSTCYMDTIGVPGPLIQNMMHALWRFLCICAFLMFVVLIVLAFGDEYNISGTNQMLATLAGGFLPWVFSNILFKPRDPVALDVNNLSFKSNFKAKIEEYIQNWDIGDIELEGTSKINETTKEPRSHIARLSDSEHNTVISKVESGHEGFPELLSNSSSMLLSDYSGVLEGNDDCDVDLIVLDKNSNRYNV